MSLALPILSKKKHHSSRFIELDILRGVAIISMIFLHILWDLDYFGLIPLDSGVYQYNKIIPAIFFLLIGICLMITVNRKKAVPDKIWKQHLLVRGLWVFSLGMIFTIITLIFMPEKPIFFGVLHCIGLSIILSIPFLHFRAYNLVFAGVIFVATYIVNLFPAENPTILHFALGFHQADVSKYTIDYFPLLPWFGICLFGIALGSWLYKDGKRNFKFPDLSQHKSVSLFSWIGEHSLTIYLFHQPVIAGVLTLFVVL